MPGADNARIAVVAFRTPGADRTARAPWPAFEFPFVQRARQVAANVGQDVDGLTLTEDQQRNPFHHLLVELAVGQLGQRRQRVPAFGEAVREFFTMVNARS